MNYTCRLIFIFIAISLPFNSYSAEETLEQENKHYEQALTSFEQKDYRTAMIHLKNTFTINRSNLPGRILYAKILLAHNNGVGAEVELAYAKELGGDFNVLLPLQAKAFLSQQRFNKVVEITGAANRGQITETKLAYFRGQAYLGLNKFLFAEESFDSALSLTPKHSPSNLGKAQVFIARKQFSLAEQYTEKSLKGYNPPENARVIRARLYMVSGNAEQAIKQLELAIASKANYLAARLLLAEVFLSQGEMEKAEVEIDYILDLAPKEPQSNFLKAIVVTSKSEDVTLENTNETLSNILKTLGSISTEVIDDNPQYLFLTGYILYKQQSFVGAQDFFEQYLKVVNDLRAIIILGKIQLHVEDYIGARRMLTKANLKFPDNEAILVMLGEANMALDDQLQAQRNFIQALALNPSNYNTSLNLANSYMQQNKYHQAMESTGNIRETYPNLTKALLVEYQCLVALKMHEQAQARSERLIATHPDNTRYYYLHGLTYFSLKDFSSAHYYFTTAVEIEPSYVDAKVGLIKILLVEEKTDLALKKLQTLLVNNPDNVTIMLSIADAYKGQSNDTSEVVWLEKVLAFDIANTEALVSLDKNYRRTNQLNKMRIKLEQVIEKSPDEYSYKLLGGVYLTLRDYPKALKNYRSYAEIAKDRGVGLLTLANAQLTAKKINPAISTLQKTLLWNDDIIEAHIILTRLLIAKNEFERANRQIEIIRNKNNKLDIADLLQGDFYMRQGLFKQALKHYEKAYNKTASVKSILSLYGTYKALKQYKSAETLLVKNLDYENKKHYSLVVALADVYRLKDKFQLNIALYEKAISHHPDSVVLLNNYANVLIENKQPEEALIYAQQAIGISAENVIVMDTLAAVFLAKEQFDDALSILRKALAINSNNNSVKYHIAIALEGLGRRDAAINQLVELVESTRNFKEKNKAKLLLDSWVKS